MFEEYPEYQREMLNSAYTVIDRLEKWRFLSTFEPEDGGFMFSIDPVVQFITQEINKEYGGHSGSSMAMTMRIMQKIAQEK
jgi:hypothetical protein